MFAVIHLGGTQYKVSEGDSLVVDQLSYKKGQEFTLDQVLLFAQDHTVTVGTPYLPAANVIATVVEEKLGDKLRVAKFKAKARYRRVRGFRQAQSVIVIKKIAGSKPVEKEPAVKKTTAKRPKTKI